MTASNENGFLDLLFALLAFMLITGTVLIAIGGIYYNFIEPNF